MKTIKWKKFLLIAWPPKEHCYIEGLLNDYGCLSDGAIGKKKRKIEWMFIPFKNLTLLSKQWEMTGAHVMKYCVVLTSPGVSCQTLRLKVWLSHLLAVQSQALVVFLQASIFSSAKWGGCNAQHSTDVKMKSNDSRRSTGQGWYPWSFRKYQLLALQSHSFFVYKRATEWSGCFFIDNLCQMNLFCDNILPNCHVTVRLREGQSLGSVFLT